MLCRRYPALVALLASAIAWGCSATPLPEPPAEALDFARIHGPEVSPATNVIEIVGEPGAGPPGRVLRVTNLDRTDPPVDTPIADDGSFALSVAGGMWDELRFHTRYGRDRDEPVDLVWATGTPIPAARIPCVQPVPLQQRDFGFAPAGGAPVSGTVTLHNDCPTSVEVTGAGLRHTGSAFTIGTTEIEPPQGMAPGEEARLSIDFAPTAVGDAEAILLLQLRLDDEEARYPVTLYGDGE